MLSVVALGIGCRTGKWSMTAKLARGGRRLEGAQGVRNSRRRARGDSHESPRGILVGEGEVFYRILKA